MVFQQVYHLMQLEFIRSIPGFENSHITRPAMQLNMTILIQEI